MDKTNDELRQRVAEQQQQIIDLQALIKVYDNKDKLSTEFIKNICSSINKIGNAVQGMSEPQVDIK